MHGFPSRLLEMWHVTCFRVRDRVKPLIRGAGREFCWRHDFLINSRTSLGLRSPTTSMCLLTDLWLLPIALLCCSYPLDQNSDTYYYAMIWLFAELQAATNKKKKKKNKTSLFTFVLRLRKASANRFLKINTTLTKVSRRCPRRANLF